MHKNDGYALLIGVEDYSAFDGSRRQAIGTSDLPGSRNDVRAYWALCRKLGMAPENIRVLTSPPLDPAELEGAGPDNVAAATREEIIAKVEWLADKLGQRARPAGLLAFSGHGDVTPRGLAVCPSDVTLGEGGLDGAVTYAEVDARIEARGAGENLTVLLDTCHAGAAGDARGRELTLRKRPLAEEPPRDAIGARVITAARRDQVACQAVLGGQWRGVFSWAITTAMEQWQIREDGPATRLDVTYGKLVETAERLMAAVWFDQRPELSGPSGLAELAVLQRGFEARPGGTSERPNADRRTQQLDPGQLNYVIYTINDASGTCLGKVLVTGATAGDGYEANREYWYLTTNLSNSAAVTFVGGASQSWSTTPSGLGTLSFKTNRTPSWTSGTPRGTFLLESNVFTGEHVGINWQITYSSGTWGGSIYWWHSNQNNIFGPGTSNTLSPGTPGTGTWYYYQTSPI